ncbi:MAG: translation initiation factor [Candidatus Sumerlaea sp.]|nr:translation initiation factor [Candidatus Sumerlaea chitinivorans]GIX43911.1 MAG: translation initiation factor [Candidatus Sumerlaea sp.]
MTSAKDSNDTPRTRLVFSTELGDLRKVASKPEVEAPPPKPVSRQHSITVALDTKGRRGKAVTVISGLELPPAALEMIAKDLKAKCGAGGTVEGSQILIQGDQRERVSAYLSQLGYRVKTR